MLSPSNVMFVRAAPGFTDYRPIAKKLKAGQGVPGFVKATEGYHVCHVIEFCYPATTI